MSDELEPPAPGSAPPPSPTTKAIRERTYRDWFGDRWDDVKAIGGALMLTIRFIVWIFDLDDGAGSIDWRKAAPSATKLSGLAMVLVGLWVVIHRCQLVLAANAAACGTDAALNALMIAGVTALFGRAVWKAFLARNTFSTSTTAAASVTYARRDENISIEETRRIIEERNVEDGSPPRSMPATGATEPE